MQLSSTVSRDQKIYCWIVWDNNGVCMQGGGGGNLLVFDAKRSRVRSAILFF